MSALSSKVQSSFLVPIFSFCLFLSAFAMFSLQPMIGKMLLPIVGGAPSGWVVAMAFFQIMLLIGYLLAHFFSKFSARKHGALYLAMLAIGAFFLPIDIRSMNVLELMPAALGVFSLLTITVSLPFVALSATSSTIQRLFTATGHSSAHDPYFLYAASNLGSFAGLFFYPFIIEPFFKISHQALMWAVLYAILAGVALACLFLSKRETEPVQQTIKKSIPLSWRQRGEWILLAFIPSSLLLGVTTYITTDIMSAPLIWVIPLGIYLLTFVMAFSNKKQVSLKILEILLIGGVSVSIILITMKTGIVSVTPKSLPFHLMVFFVAALYCHQCLASQRPLSDNSHLTEFYLYLSVGGALGGIFNAFFAPNLFDRLIEYPIVLISSLLLLPFLQNARRTKRIALLLIVATLCFSNFPPRLLMLILLTAKFYLLTFACYCYQLSQIISLVYSRSFFVLSLIGVFIISVFILPDSNLIKTARNFYGVIKIHTTTATEGNKVYNVVNLQHGTTLHGFQIIDKNLKTWVTSYYAKNGPLGDIFDSYRPMNIGVVGLGTGAINCYAHPDRQYTFFEIDPAIEHVANDYFSFLSDCKSKSAPKIIIGDGRLELEKLKNEKYDLLVLDAFSSDVIPTHLLTQEAFDVYENDP